MFLVMLAAFLGCGSAKIREHVPETGTLMVQANGLTFHYFEEGDGPLVLLMHGFPDTAHTWDDVRPALAEAGYRAVSPFTRGYAPTGIPAEDTDAETMGQDVLALIAALGEESAIVVGHDWGAQAAYAAAHLDPSKIDKLVVVAIPHPDTLRPTLSTLWSGRHFFYLNRSSGVSRMQKNDFAHVNALYARWAPTWDVSSEELEPVKNVFAREDSLNAALGYYRTAEFSATPLFAQDLMVNTLLIGGREDLLPESAFTVDSVTRFGADHEVVMLDAGHFPHREAPEAFMDALLRFLGS
ncbi:MAG: alpha/beta hydrolase [Myxococcota bacterium]